MLRKMARSYRPSSVTRGVVTVRTSRQSCSKAGKNTSLGVVRESRFVAASSKKNGTFAARPPAPTNRQVSISRPDPPQLGG